MRRHLHRRARGRFIEAVRCFAAGRMKRSDETIPYGLLHLDDAGRVLDHEESRYGYLAGRDLFASVAAFRRSPGLRRRFEDFVARREKRCAVRLAVGTGGETETIRVLFVRAFAGLTVTRISAVKVEDRRAG